MKITESINMQQHISAWKDRFNTEVSYYGGREVAFSPAVQAQVSPYGAISTGEMPEYHSLHGVLIANEYTGWMDECNSITNTCYIGDWSWLNKVLLKGPDVIKCMEASTINGYNKFPIGKGKHIISIREDGKMLGEGLAFRLSEDEILCTGGLTITEGQMLKTTGFNVEYKDITADEYIYHVQGPKTRTILEKASNENLEDIEFGCFRNITIAGKEVRIYRGGMSGELGYELEGNSKDGSIIWQAVVDAGKEEGIRQLGFKSLMLNHLQAFFPTIWVDYIPAIFPKEAEGEVAALYRSPVDFGWGNRIAKDREFPGKDVLLKEIENPTNKTVMLEWNNEDCISIFASLFDENNESFEQFSLPVNTSSPIGEMCCPVFNNKDEFIGFATNRGYSCQFKKFLSITYLNANYAKEDTEVYVLYGSNGKRQKKIKAVVKPAPYKIDVRRK